MARYLGRRFRVTTAADGGAALEELAKEKFDLVLTDLRMPHCSGMDVLEAVRKQQNPPSCILLTAYGSIEDAVTAVKQGAFDFVTKPVKLDKLEEVINAALEERKKNTAPADPVPATTALALANLRRPTELTRDLVLPNPADGSGPMANVMHLVNTVGADPFDRPALGRKRHRQRGDCAAPARRERAARPFCRGPLCGFDFDLARKRAFRL